jgi:endogenous inhibitor of DNA gyrase (YacG/DUF329 family)
MAVNLMTTSLDKIVCPTCQKQGSWKQDNPFRPFCSARCKLIDLGEWADESRKIPSDTINPENLDSNEDQDI